MDAIYALESELQKWHARILGKGVFGSVYRCTYLSKDYAIKIGLDLKHEKRVHTLIWRELPASAHQYFAKPLANWGCHAPDFPHKFPAVWAALRRLDYESTPQPCNQIFVLEYEEGYRTLGDFLNSIQKDPKKPFYLREIRDQAARALYALHRAGFAHADFHTGNVLVRREPNGQIHIKIIDFGLAKPLWLRKGPGMYLENGKEVYHHNNVAFIKGETRKLGISPRSIDFFEGLYDNEFRDLYKKLKHTNNNLERFTRNAAARNITRALRRRGTQLKWSTLAVRAASKKKTIGGAPASKRHRPPPVINLERATFVDLT